MRFESKELERYGLKFGDIVMCEGGESFFKELMAFAQDLTEEEQRAARENLSEEELAIFDLLTQPEPKLTDKEKDQVKKVAKELLAKLKAEKLVLDWKLKTQTKADVEKTIWQCFRALPATYTPALQKEKRIKTYAHIYENYFGAGRSVYPMLLSVCTSARWPCIGSPTAIFLMIRY